MTKERSILFSAPMVRAILTGRKTQTRRACKPYLQDYNTVWKSDTRHNFDFHNQNSIGQVVDCPYGKPGDILYVKEAAWMWCEKRPNGITKTGRHKWHYVPMEAAPVYYCADHPDKPSVAAVSPETGNQWLWRKKIGRFLPRWAVRLRVVIKDVRVERLHDISEDDAKAEGWPGPETPLGYPVNPPIKWFEALWWSINGVESWEANPYVWAITFEKVKP